MTPKQQSAHDRAEAAMRAEIEACRRIVDEIRRELRRDIARMSCAG